MATEKGTFSSTTAYVGVKGSSTLRTWKPERAALRSLLPDARDAVCAICLTLTLAVQISLKRDAESRRFPTL